jgi:hypothetical protein
MTRNDAFKMNIAEISEIIRSYEFMIENRLSFKYFSRKGKLGFENTIMMLLNFMKKSKQAEINNFFERVIGSTDVVRKQSFDEAREKISHIAFKMLYEVSVRNGLSIEDAILFEGFRLLAVDGSTLLLENSKELFNYFGPSTSSKDDVYARISVVYDVLNNFIVDADITPYHKGEREIAAAQINNLKIKNALFLYDRGYWSPKLISMMCDKKNKFLMRMSSNACKFVTDSKNDSGYFTIKYEKKEYNLRFYKFALPSGEIETLATNLDIAIIPDDRLCKLYFMRWGVETKYGLIKTKLKMENFSGKSVLAVLQDFYATMFLSNLIAFAQYVSDDRIKEKNINSNLKYSYKTNINQAIGFLKDKLVIAMLEKNPAKRDILTNYLFDNIANNSIPIRLNRHFVRKESTIRYRKRAVLKNSL